MYGLEAISAHNGWAMALAGALIVFSGLVVLCAVISQLHKILKIWDKKQPLLPEDLDPDIEDEPEDEPLISLPKELPSDINEVAKLYKPLIDEIGDTFYLSSLYAIAKKNEFPHPHITLSAFRECEIMIPHGDGVFSWNQPEENEKG
ncbi:MAG: OadG family protein [Desulfobacterales bacterium]|nr:MAG: OadG family protein [Desulfobacterales bacterium]